MRKILTTLILLLYCILLAQILVFKNLPVFRFAGVMLNFGGTHVGPANLIPFKSILPYLLGERGLLAAVLNLGGNIGLLVPIGFMLPIVRPNTGLPGITLLAFISGFSIELTQAVFRLGIFDVDDLLLNGLGVLLGYALFRAFMRRTP